MISQSVEYALRAVVTLVQNEGRPCTAKQIAEITLVPSAYLSKLMQGLVRSGLVRSQRGLHGGFVLTKSPHDLAIWDVVAAVEPFKRIETCPLGIQSHGANLCPLHRRLDRAMATIESMFRETTLAELLSHPGSVTPLCETQRVFALEKPGKAAPRAKQAKKK